MKIYRFVDNYDFSCNTYLVSENDCCILIDCGFLNEELLTLINNHRYFEGVILTHKHFDHIKGLESILKIYNDLKIYSFNSNDSFFNNSFNNCSLNMYNREIIIDYPTINLIEGLNNVTQFDFEVIYTPGHTSDSICIKLGNNLFTGDTLFNTSVGRCDLPTSNYIELNLSLNKLKNIIENEYLLIYPGHGNCIDSHDILKVNMYIK